MSYSKKQILVTGGAGFIGSHLCKRLVKEGNHVICMDNFFTGASENIAELLDNPHFELVRHDVTQAYSFYIDEIYNLACPASPVHYQRDPIATFMTSILGARHALELADKWNAKVLQASTSEVYGDPLVHPQDEAYWGHVNINGIRSCYDEGKRGAETLFCDFNRAHNTRIRIVRIFNTYGPQMNPQDGRVVSNFINQALRGEDLTVYGDGTQTRSFCYVDDLVEGFIRLMAAPDSINFPINMGNPDEFTMLDLAEKVLALTGSSSKLIMSALPQDDPKQRKPDITLAKKTLGWEPKILLDEGIKKTISYYRSLM